ncbi:MAG: M14 family zinc carboxypeptidase [Limnohabitans sp.]|nr:M14 family zinc carboxypeptidase [Limnohabitans sp.]
MKFLNLFFLLSFYLSFSQENYQKVRIYYKTDTELQKIVKIGQLDHFKREKNVFIECDVPERLVKGIKLEGFKVIVLEKNLNEYYKRKSQSELSPKSRNKNFSTYCNQALGSDPVNYNTGSMGGYLTYSECLAELDQMRTLYPNLITAKAGISTFQTSQNRPIHFVKISDNPDTDENEKRVLYTSLHHAREPGSMQQLIYFMWYILENYDKDPEIRDLVNNSEIYCVPVVNPDGYVYNQTTNPTGGGMWRKNRRGGYGVDNNRNYGYQWGTSGTSTTNTADDTYCGTSAFSEPENQAIKWLTQQKNFIAAFNNHSYANDLLFPYGWATNTPTPDNSKYLAISGEMVKYSGFQNYISADMYPASGDSDDWMYGGDIATKPKIFAFTPEIGTDFWETPAQTAISNYNMLYSNLMLLRYIHNYALFKDTSSNFISNTTYNFTYSLRRLGNVDNQNFTVKVVPVSSNILSVANLNTHSSVGFNGVVNGTYQLNLATGITNGTPITFTVEINNGTYTQTETITKYFGPTEDRFTESAGNLTQWTNSTGWGTSTTTYYSAPSSITDSSTGNYANNANKNIKTTTAISLLNAVQAEITFYAKWDLEKGKDFVQLEISKDNGTTWIAQCGKYTSEGTSIQDVNRPVYDGIQSTWVQESINLSDYLGQNILVRFRLKSNASNVKDGFYLDDLKVTIIPTAPLSTSDVAFNNLTISPNPASDSIEISSITDIKNYRIIDMNGKIIREDELNSKSINVSTISEGIYLFEVSKEKEKKQIKFIIKR